MCKMCSGSGLIPVFSYRSNQGKLYPIEQNFKCPCDVIKYQYKKDIGRGKDRVVVVKDAAVAFSGKPQFPVPNNTDYLVAYQIGKYASLAIYHKTGKGVIEWTDQMQSEMEGYQRALS